MEPQVCHVQLIFLWGRSAAIMSRWSPCLITAGWKTRWSACLLGVFTAGWLTRIGCHSFPGERSCYVASPQASGSIPSTQTSSQLVMQVSTSCRDWLKRLRQTYAPHNAELRSSWWHRVILHSVLYSRVIVRVPKPTSATTPQGNLATRQRKERKMLKPCISSRQDPAKSSRSWQPGTGTVK